MTCNKHCQFKDNRILFWLIASLVIFFIPLSALAATSVGKDIQVTATVPSDVSEIHSFHRINANETLADPVNHWFVLHIHARDENNKPLANKKVEAHTNRGSIDVLEYIIETDGQLEIQQEKDGQTDANGKTTFKISSWTPGEVTINITVDNIVELEPIKVTFLPLPFPTDVTVGIKVPGIEKELILYAPTNKSEALTENSQELSEEKKEAKRLANTGTKIDLPFWPLLIIAILIICCPILLIWNFVNLRRVKRMERKEVELLEKITNQKELNN